MIGELLVSKLIVVLNKCDLLAKENRDQILAKKIENLKKVFSKTKFTENVPIVPISTLPQEDDKLKTQEISSD